MNPIHAFFLSVIEGFTEFLPVSSTGHLILASKIFKIDSSEFLKSFEILIQFGAILSVVFLYGKTLVEKANYWKKITASFLPTAVAGLVFYKSIKTYLLDNAAVTVTSLFLGGILLILFEKFYRNKESKNIESMSYKDAILIGILQSISMVPGVSRAAATIIGGLIIGLPRKEAVKYSFFLAIPTMLAASLLDLSKSAIGFNSHEYLLLAIGFAGAFCSALIAVKSFLRFVKNNDFIPFGIYRILISIVYFLFMLR